MIFIEKNKKREAVSFENIYQWTGALYLPNLQFKSLSLLKKLSRRGAQLESRGEVTFEQAWLGKYFRKEIVLEKIAPVSLRWISDRIGWGVFAEKKLSKMDFIAEYTGVVRKKLKEDRHNSYCFEYRILYEEEAKFNIDARAKGGIARYINHSPNGNLESALAIVDGICHIILYAKREILLGEQLLYDYGPDYWKSRGYALSL